MQDDALHTRRGGGRRTCLRLEVQLHDVRDGGERPARKRAKVYQTNLTNT
jgi:hypothetical protein